MPLVHRLDVLLIQRCIWHCLVPYRCLFLGHTRVASPTSSISVAISLTLLMSVDIIRSPVLWTVDLMCCACFFFIFSQLTFPDACKPKFSKLFHMTWLYSKKKRCYADFIKVPHNKNEGRKPQIPPNLASNCNILCTVTRNVEEK